MNSRTAAILAIAFSVLITGCRDGKGRVSVESVGSESSVDVGIESRSGTQAITASIQPVSAPPEMKSSRYSLYIDQSEGQ